MVTERQVRGQARSGWKHAAGDHAESRGESVCGAESDGRGERMMRTARPGRVMGAQRGVLLDAFGSMVCGVTGAMVCEVLRAITIACVAIRMSAMVLVYGAAACVLRESRERQHEKTHDARPDDKDGRAKQKCGCANPERETASTQRAQTAALCYPIRNLTVAMSTHRIVHETIQESQ